jgi:hypothetical protein
LKTGISIEKSLGSLQKYMEQEKFRGFDPYDGLKSPLFKLPLLKTNKKIRFAFQQVIKRSSINLRSLFGIKKGKNPVTLGLSIQAYAYLTEIYPEKKAHYLKQIDELLVDLENLASKGFSGICWGYDFDWEARYATIKADEPTVVATGIITNALFECWQITGNKKCADFVVSSSNFVLHDLKRTYLQETDLFCFSYSSLDSQTVLNASMKGVRVLAQTNFITKDESLKPIAKNAVLFVLKQQQKNGSFAYSDKRENIDNYHTGYVLDCLEAYQALFQDKEFEENINRGLAFYKQNFFTDDNAPKFYNSEFYPIDCTAAGQSLLTLTRFENLVLSKNVALFTVNNMQDSKGFFYFRKYKNTLNKTSFMRWSNAWMFVGLSYLLYKSEKNQQ